MKVEPDSGADVNLMDEFSNFILLFVTLRSLGFANEPSGLICIIHKSRSVALLNNGGEFIFPFITMKTSWMNFTLPI
jgi:hypothetical protein